MPAAKMDPRKEEDALLKPDALERAKDGLHPYLATALEAEGLTEAEARDAANAILDRALAALLIPHRPSL